MRIKNLVISNFRNIAEMSIEATETINFFSGPNGAGKSSILEAIHLLSSGKSYRTHIINELIKKNTSELIVRSEFSGTVAGQHSAGLLKKTSGELQLRLDQEDAKSTADVARLFPVRTIHPEMHELVKGGPSVRRKFLDWGVFHVEQQFHLYWKRYNFALKQRNSLLKNRTINRVELDAWGSELANSGLQIDQLRRTYLDHLESAFQKWVIHFEVNGNVKLSYKKGWEKDIDLLNALTSSIDNCIRYRTTTVGPHRSDLLISFDGYPAKQVVSRGQQKLLVYALVFAQIELHREKTSEFPVLLCDDPEAELDEHHRDLLLKGIRQFGLQTFITGNDSTTWLAENTDKKFSVEKGVTAVQQ